MVRPRNSSSSASSRSFSPTAGSKPWGRHLFPDTFTPAARSTRPGKTLHRPKHGEKRHGAAWRGFFFGCGEGVVHHPSFSPLLTSSWELGDELTSQSPSFCRAGHIPKLPPCSPVCCTMGCAGLSTPSFLCQCWGGGQPAC